MVGSSNRTKTSVVIVLLAAGAIIVAGSAGQFDGALYYIVLATGGLLGVGAIAALYQLRYA